MRYKVKIENQWFDVEIEDLRGRPVIATVEGESFEVWPSTGLQTQPLKAAKPLRTTVASEPVPGPLPAQRLAPAPGDADTKAVHAPIPGVIVSIGVQPGDEVTAGQELCVLEAMKMNNAIRASRAGRVATVYVSVGQHVKHHEVLIEYTD